MSASFFSSFIVFAITGLLAWLEMSGHTLPLPFKVIGDGSWLKGVDGAGLKIILVVSIVSSGLYFFYYSAMCEMEEGYRNILKKSGILEWIVRVVNQSLFMLIWFALQYDPVWFGRYYVCLYLTFIVWDLCTSKTFRAENTDAQEKGLTEKIRDRLVRADALGLVSVVIFVLLLNGDYEPKDKIAYLTGACIAIAFFAVWGIYEGWKANKFIPFQPKYWKRSEMV